VTPLQPVGIGALLRTARTERNVTLEQASGTTRIPLRILEALEREEASGLPPYVYTVGLLRNYARFLGVDPGVAVAQWPQERGATAPTSTPQGSRTKRTLETRQWYVDRARAVTRGTLTQRLVGYGGAGVLMAIVGLFIALQLLRFAAPPPLTVNVPPNESTTLQQGNVSATVSGTSRANVRIRVTTGGGAVLTTTADGGGAWSLDVPLAIGANQVTIQAEDPATGTTSSEPVQRVFIVPRRVGAAPRLDLAAPAADAVIESGDVPLALTSDPGTPLTITATPATGGVAVIVRLVADADGKASGALSLPTGSWTINATAGASGATQSQASRRVRVHYTGVIVALRGTGASTWVRAWIDGVIDVGVGATGRTLRAGDMLTLTGTRMVEIRFGSAPDITVTLNGRILTPLGDAGVATTWRFAADGSVKRSARK